MQRYLSVVLTGLLVALFLTSGTLAQQKQGSAMSQYGGTLRIVRADGPRVLGYAPEMGPRDELGVIPAFERVMDYVIVNGKLELVPYLAESVTVAKDHRSITIKLRKGIKFHDGSDMNAEAVAWNYQICKDNQRLQYDKYVEKIEVTDPYTVVLRITDYHNLLLHGLGWVPIYSKQAWDKAGGGNIDKSKEWARANIVGTGPFKLAEYKRDNYLKFVRNENYWQKGKPYLDGITTHYVPDPVTASAMLQSKEADMWADPPISDQSDLEKKGFVRHTGPNTWLMQLIPDTKNSPVWQNKLVREAAEYAIDKGAIAKALGFGYYVPTTMLAPPGRWGFDPAYKGRSYNPSQARKLLAEAGYPNGLKVNLLVMAGAANQAAATALKRYMDDAGFQVDLDVADSGRFFGSVYRTGWKDLVWMNPTDSAPNFLLSFHRYFGHDPLNPFFNYVLPPELKKMSEESITYDKESDQRAIIGKIVRLMADQVLTIPCYTVPNAYITQPGVHIDYLLQGMGTWMTQDMWMEKR